MGQLSDSALLALSNTIKNETIAQANTALRIGQMFENSIDSKLNNIPFTGYSATTLININSRVLTSSFNVYSGNTANLINTKIGSANNGLTKAGTNIHLGGALTGATQIGLSTNNITFTATTGTLRYGGNYRVNFVDKSLVDVGYVTGLTNTLLTKSVFNTFTGTTAPLTYQSKSSINTLTGTTLPATYETKSGFNSYTGATNSRINTIETNYLTGATNLGTGNGLFTSVSGHKTQFKSLVAGSNVTLTPTSTGITISSTGGGGGGISTANNGLTVAGSNVHLGGALTGATQIGLGNNNVTFTGTTGTLRYGSDLSSQYNVRSLVDKGFVTGITSTLLLTSAFNTYSGNTSNLINTKIGSANNGLTKAGTNIHLGGALTGTTQIGLGANNLTFTGTTGTLRYGSDLSAQYNVRSLVDKGFVTGITSTLVASANNGLTKSGQNVHLGGTLTGATTIDASTFNFILTGTSSQLNLNRTTGSINLRGRNSVNIFGASIAGVDRVQLKLAATGATFTDSRTGTTAHGIEYAADYSANYTKRSVVDLGYTTGRTNQLNGIITTASATGNSLTNYVGISATTSLNYFLPSSPKLFQQIIISDIKGNCGTANVTINGNGKIINGSSTAIINTNYGSILFIYNGINWSGCGFTT